MEVRSGITDIRQPLVSRTHDRSLLAVFEKFELGVGNKYGTCGNIQDMFYSLNLKTFKYEGLFKEKSFCQVVSAPMLLARLVSAGCPITVLGQQGYKCTWEAILKHKETGNVITFYDFKGGSSFGSDVFGKRVQKSFLNDVETLLLSLISENFPHPYDGCVVGEIA